MIIETSALVAIVLGEESATELAAATYHDEIRLISAAALYEASAVLWRRSGDVGVEMLDKFIREVGVTVLPFGDEQARLARDAYRRYGRGSGDPAQLNFGDCFSYALAKIVGEPLLCVGNDFARTDIRIVELTP